MRIPFVAAATAMVFAGTASAHSDLPRVDWCSAGNVAYVADFQLSGTDLAGTCTADGSNGTKGHVTGKRANPTPEHCGQFDPPYSAARAAAGGNCAGYGLPGQMQNDFGTTAAIVTGPPSYLSPAHHEIYRLEEGVWGMCAICLPPAPAEPAQPIGKPQR